VLNEAKASSRSAITSISALIGHLGYAWPGSSRRERSTFLDVGCWRYFFTYGAGARIAEAMAVLFSPVHRLTLESVCRRVNRPTRRTAIDATA
jgi:hypothetical protein